MSDIAENAPIECYESAFDHEYGQSPADFRDIQALQEIVDGIEIHVVYWVSQALANHWKLLI